MCKLSVTKLILTVKNDQSLCLLAPLRQKKETFNSNMKKMSALARWHHHGWHLIERKELTNKGFDTHIIFSPSNLYLVFTQKWKIHTAASQHITTDEIPKVIMLLAFYNEGKAAWHLLLCLICLWFQIVDEISSSATSTYHPYSFIPVILHWALPVINLTFFP
jgi:hypothetical protein